MEPDFDERTAIQRLKAGDLMALEPLVRTHQLEAIRTAYLIVRDRALAEDVAQAAFLSLPGRLKAFNFELPFRPWFLRLVAREALKALGRRRRELSLDGLDGVLAALPDPEDAAARAELRAEVWAALERLSPERRAAVVLRYYAGLSEAEIAARLRRPLGTVKWQLHAARRQLRRLLEGVWAGSSQRQPQIVGGDAHDPP